VEHVEHLSAAGGGHAAGTCNRRPNGIIALALGLFAAPMFRTEQFSVSDFWLAAISTYEAAKLDEPSKVEKDLTERGYSVYRPKFRSRVSVRGVRRWVAGFLLDSYVLVRYVDASIDWFANLTSSKFVRDALHVGDKPMLARDAEVCRLRETERRGFVPVPTNTPDRGAKGRVTRGAFSMQAAEFVSRDEESGFDEVLVQLFGRPNQIVVPIGDWAPV
jgi:transcription antitermination factor NusG